MATLIIKQGLIFFLAIFILFGCSSSTSSDIDLAHVNIRAVELADFKQFGQPNDEIVRSYTDEESIATFVDALNSASKIEGAVDIAYATFDIHIIHRDGHERRFHFVISNESERGTVVDPDQTETAYELSKEDTSQLQDLLFE